MKLKYILVVVALHGCLPPSLDSGVDADGDGWFEGVGPEWDCHDDEPDAYPGHPERCIDGLDNDCDGWPDGDALPFQPQLSDGLDTTSEGGWEVLVGSEADLVTTEDGIEIAGAPLVIARALGAECWSRTRLTLGWTHAPDGGMDFEVVMMASGEWDETNERPADGYLFRWDRVADGGSPESVFDLWRLDGGERTWLNHSTADPQGDAWSYYPMVTMKAASDDLDVGTELVLGFGSGFETLATVDRTTARLTTGGIVLAFGEKSVGGRLTEVVLEEM